MFLKPLATLLLLLPALVLGEQICGDRAVSTASASHFVIAAATPDTVRHVASGLIWKRCPVGFSLNDRSTESYFDDRCDPLPGETGRLTWEQAFEAVNGANPALALAGWRLPGVKELSWLTEFRCVRPALNTNIFPIVGHDIYWSSTTYRDGREAATFDFSIGRNATGRKDLEAHSVRLVIGGI